MAKIKHIDTGTQCEKTEFEDENLHEVLEDGDGVLLISSPPTGYYKVTNIYYDYENDEQVVIRQDTPN
jgi:hypothetical protein